MGLRVSRNWIWAVTTHKIDIKAFSHKTLTIRVPQMSSSCFAKIFLEGMFDMGCHHNFFQVDKGFSKVWHWGHINITTLVEGSSKKVKVGEKCIEGSGSWPPLKQHRLLIEATLSFTAKSPHHCHFFLHPIPASETLDTYWLLSNIQMLRFRVVDNMGSVNGDYSGLHIYLRGYSNMGGQIALQFLWNTSGKLLHPPFNCIDLVTVSLVWGISERGCKKS